MNPDPDEGLLSDWERAILHELEWEIETTDPDLAASFDLLEQRVVPTAVGAMVALTAFSVTVVITLAGLATMGLGLGLALVPGLPMPGSRQR